MRAGRLRHLVIRLGLDGVRQVRELDGVLYKKHRHVVAHDVPVAFVGIKLDGKAAHIASRVFRSAFARYS